MTKSFIDDHEKENYIGGKFNMRKKALVGTILLETKTIYEYVRIVLILIKTLLYSSGYDF